MTEDKLTEKKKEIQDLGLDAIKEYFKIDSSKLGRLDRNLLVYLFQRAKIGMQFEKEMNVSKRAVEGNYLKVFRMVAEDKKEIRRLIKKSIPNYLPE